MNLYHLPGEGRGFFAEVSIEVWQDCFVVLHSFSDSVPLLDYAQSVQLPMD